MAHPKKRQRQIQNEVARSEKKHPKQKPEHPMQAGARAYPAPPFPKQHQPKPGAESTLNPHVAILFAREGADVAIVYLSEDDDAKVTRQNVEAEGRRCILISGDVSDKKFCEEAVAKTIKKLGTLDILVNNAAFQVHTAQLRDLTSKHFDETLKTNLYGYFYMARAAVEKMKPGSAIINTGSVTGILGSPTHLVPRGIRVNCVAPGRVWTPLNPSDKEAEDVSKFGSKVPMKRPAQPEEIAPAYVFLASPQCSSYITGEVLPIIGGYNGG